MAWDDAIDPESLQPPADLGELHLRMLKAIRRLKPIVLRNRAVGTGITMLAHGQTGIPRWVGVTPQSSTVTQPTPADTKFIYLQAAVACVVDVVLVM